MSMSEKIAEALFDCLIDAPVESQKRLFETLEKYKVAYGRSYDAVRRQPFCRNLIDSIEEAERFVEDFTRDSDDADLSPSGPIG